MAIKTFKDYPNTETPVSAENINEVITTILKIFGADEDTFSEASTYAVDDFVIYQNTLWKCTTAVTTAGAWTGATNWEEKSILLNGTKLQIDEDLIPKDIVLWENPNPTSSFAAQTISLDLTNYNKFIIICLTGDNYSTHIITKGIRTRINTTGYLVSDNSFVRNLTISDSGVTFENCSGYGVGSNSAFSATINSGLIPYQIIGSKYK